jgi:hypothetical protein
VNEAVPAALAVAGTALMAVAFFGPFRRHPIADADADTGAANGAVRNGTLAWPALVEASASAIDVPARIDLADALGALQSAWSASILQKAYETESDPGVRSAIEAALRQAQDRLLSSSQSLVT